MAAAGHTFPNYTQLMGTKSSSFSSLSGATTLGALLIHSTSPTITWNSTSQAWTSVANFLANAGSALTEEAGSGYSRQTLSSVTFATSGLVSTLNCSALVWTTSTISATYLLIFDFTGHSIASANDSTSQVLAYQDFGGTEADVAGTFTFTPSGGIATWTAS